MASGEEPADLGDLARVLGHVRLPPRPGRARQRGRFAQHLGRARDREARRDGVPEPAVVGAMPARDEVGRFTQRAFEDRRWLDGRVVGPPIHHHLAQDRPDAVRLGGPERDVHRRLVDDAVGEDRRRPGALRRPRRWPARAARRRPGRTTSARSGRSAGRARSGGRARTRRRHSGAAAGGRACRPSRA